jgi:nucleolar protein TMA23
MDSYALLTSQGWRGSGHSLHPTSDKTGLSRPLLVSRKQNNLGVGKKQHKTSDMWWMNAFDKSLKGLDTAEEGKVVQTVTNGGLDMVAKGGAKFVGSGGLYSSFVRGESLSGTITPEEVQETPVSKKRRMGEDGLETKEERRARKAANRAARARSLLNVEIPLPAQCNEPAPFKKDDGNIFVEEVETKKQRRERRKQKKLEKIEKLMRQVEEDDMKDSIQPTKRKKKRKD